MGCIEDRADDPRQTIETVRAYNQKSAHFGCQSGPNQQVIQPAVVVFLSLGTECGGLKKKPGVQGIPNGIKLGAVLVPVRTEIQTVEGGPEKEDEKAE